MNYQDEENAIFARFLRNFQSSENSESEISEISISSDSDDDNTRVIVENSNIKILLKRARFRRFSRFNVDDHLFNIEILTKDNQEIEVLSVITLIELAIKKSLSLLQEEYGSDDEQLFFLTIIDSELFNGINTGGVTFDSEAGKIANFISAKLLRYLVQSNEHLKINHSFKIAIKIATRQHVQYRKSIGQGSGIRIGIKITKSNLKSSCLLQTPHENELAFKCLLVSAILARSHYFAHFNGPQSTSDSEIWMKRNSQEGLSLIKNAILDFQTETNLSDMDLTHFDKVVPRLEFYFNCQFAILKEHKNGKNFDCLYRSSNVFTNRLPVVYLLLEENDSAFHHISLITNLLQFYKLYNKAYCPYCNKKFNLKDKHKCSMKTLEHCRSCWRTIAEDVTMFSHNDSFLFCQPKLHEEVSCLKCCRLMRSNDCQNEHRHQCRKVYFCTLCNHYISTGPSARSIEKIKHTHNCAFKKCNLCYELYLPTDEHQHTCKISSEIGQTKWAKLCLIVKKGNNLTIVKEEGQMENFSFFEIHSNLKETLKCVLFNQIYLPYAVREKLGNNFNFPNASPRFQMNSTDWENKNWAEQNILHFVIKTILTDESYENSTVFYIDQDNEYPLNEILASMLEANITEFKFIQKESRVMRIRFPCEEISFQDITNFLPKSSITNTEVLDILANLNKLIFDCLELQTMFFPVEKKNKMNFLHPFSGNFATLAGFTFAAFKWYHLPNQELYAIKDENGMHIQSSKEEMMWVQWEIFKRRHDKNQKFLHSHSKFGQKRYKSCIPDLVVKGKSQTTAMFYHGCFYHCCQLCPDGLRNNGNEKESREEIIKKDKVKLKKLKEEVPGINIKVIYGCEFQNQVSNPSRLMTSFLKFYSKNDRPKQRIKPRNALRGGRCESFCPYYEACEDEEIVHIDINSSYPFQSLGEFPVGEPTVLIGSDLNEVNYCSNAKKYFFGNEEIFGLIHCKIVAPKNLYLPYLGYRHTLNDEVLVCYSLCRKCAEKENTNRKCTHGVKNRSFVCTITSIELNSLKTLNYDIEIYEILTYSKKEKC